MESDPRRPIHGVRSTEMDPRRRLRLQGDRSNRPHASRVFPHTSTSCIVRRALLHRIVASVAVLLMLMPYVPRPRGAPDAAAHEHCIHCTGRYCMKGRCACDHERSAARVHGERMVVREQQARRHAASEHVHGEPAEGSTGLDRGIDAPRAGPSIEPCGSPELALLLPMLDKYVPSASAPPPSESTGTPLPGSSDRVLEGLVGSGVFRPPISPS